MTSLRRRSRIMRRTHGSGSAHPPTIFGLQEAAAWRVTTRTVLFIGALLLALWLLVQLRALVVQVAFSVILAAGMTPLVDRLSPSQPHSSASAHARIWAPPRALVVLALYLIMLAVCIGLGALLLPPLVSEVNDLINRLPAYAAELQDQATSLSDRYPALPALDISQGLGQLLRSGAAGLAGFVGQALALVRLALGLLGGALNGIFILVLALYITQDSERVRRYLIGFLPKQRRRQAGLITARVGDRLGGWLRGQFLLSAIIGGLTFIGLWAIGVPYALLLALIAAAGEAVPLIGPIISAVPAVAVAFPQSPLQGFLTLGLYVVIQQLENNLVVPKVMERAVALHPLAVMLALLAGATLLGVTGAILSVPTAAAVAVLLQELRAGRPRS